MSTPEMNVTAGTTYATSLAKAGFEQDVTYVLQVR